MIPGEQARATRDAYGEALLMLGERNSDVLVLDADLSRSTRTEWFAARYPERFFNAGIAEQNMVGMAAGLALCGYIPFVTTYAVFIGRAFDQIRQSVAFTGANVKIVATHAGLAASHDGGSHQGIEDLALMRVIPGMTVLSPADYYETTKAVLAAAEHPGPVYIRLQKEAVPTVLGPEAPFTIGKAVCLKPGQDIVLIATGSLVSVALAAAEALVGDGFQASVLNASTIKPLDAETVLEVLNRCGCGVVIEEHSRVGGLYEAVCSSLSCSSPFPLIPVAMPDCFGESGHWHALREHFGLSVKGIRRAAKIAIDLKHRSYSRRQT